MTVQLFGETKRASLVKRLHAPVEEEQEPKKPRIVEGSCVQGDKTEAEGQRIHLCRYSFMSKFLQLFLMLQ